MLTKPNHPGYQPAHMRQALLAGAMILFMALVLLFVALNGEFSAPEVKGYPIDTSTFKEPVLQYDPVADLAAYQAQQTEKLNRYGWVDAAHGVAHIPVERAIDLLSEQGLPVLDSSHKSGD